MICISIFISIEYIIGQDDEITFFKWLCVTERRNIKGKEKNITCAIEQPQTCNPSSMKSRFLKSIIIFKKHVFNLKHQAREYKNVKQNLKKGELIFQVDFSPNYVAKYERNSVCSLWSLKKTDLRPHKPIVQFRPKC